MKYTVFLLLLRLSFSSCQNQKVPIVLRLVLISTIKNFDFPRKDYKLIGFGAYYGRAKIEDAKLQLLQSFTKDATLSYYLPNRF